MKLRDKRAIIATNIGPKIENNPNLMNIFSLTNPNDIAETLTNELEKIIEEIAPSKRVQINKRNKKKLNADTNEAIKEADTALTLATNTLATDDFRNTKHLQNITKRK